MTDMPAETPPALDLQARTPTTADEAAPVLTEEPAESDIPASEQAMDSRRQRLTGSAAGVGSIGFDEDGAFDVGAGEKA